MTPDPKIQPSRGTRLQENSLGRSLSMRRGREWKHPWHTEAIWLPGKKAWAAFVLAGFVNGFAPLVRTTAGELRDARATFFGQLVDARSGAAEIAQLALLAIGGTGDFGGPDSTVLDVPLYQNPPVPLNGFRPIGWDGSPSVPLFFQDRGVGKPPPNLQAVLERGGKPSEDSLTPPAGNRLLRACDIWVQQPRTALTSQITVSLSSAIAGTSVVDQAIGIREAPDSQKLKIQTGTYQQVQNSKLNFQGAANLLASDYEEKTWDEILISTVYLLSPPNAAPGSQPDSTWQSFAKQSAFWNLSWSQPDAKPVFSTDIFRGITALVGVLAGGSGLGAVSFITASINDATQAAFNILQTQSLAGTFWTPTSGGTTSAWPKVAPTARPDGIDKGTTASAKAKAQKADRHNRKLDPTFPFEGQKFNLSLLK